MSTQIRYFDQFLTAVPTPPTDETLAALLAQIYQLRHNLGATAFGVACAAATTAFDARSLAVGTVALLTPFGPQ